MDKEQQLQQEIIQLQQKIQATKEELASLSDETKKLAKESEINETQTLLQKKESELQMLKADHSSEMNALKTETQNGISQNYLKLKAAGTDKKISQQEILNEVIKENQNLLIYNEYLKGSHVDQTLQEIVTNKDFEKYGATPEKRVESIFQKVNTMIVKYYRSKLDIPLHEKTPEYLNEAIVPGTEMFLMEMLKNQGNEANIGTLKDINALNFDNFTKLFNGLSSFATNFTSTFSQGSAILRATDYISTKKYFAKGDKKIGIFTNPKAFKDFLSNPIWQDAKRPLASISPAELGLDNPENVEMTEAQKEEIKQQLGNIQVVKNANTTKNVLKLLDTSEKFFASTTALSDQAVKLFDGLEGPFKLLKTFGGVDVFESMKKSPLKMVFDFIFSLLGFSGGIDGFQRKITRRRIDKDLDSQEKRSFIEETFSTYQEKKAIPLPDEKNLKALLKENLGSGFSSLPDTEKAKLDIDYPILKETLTDKLKEGTSVLHPSLLQQISTKNIQGASCILKTKNKEGKETLTVNQDKLKGNEEELAEATIKLLSSKLANNPDFLKTVDSAETVAFTMISSCIVNPEHMVEGVKIKTILPEEFYQGKREIPSAETKSNSEGQNRETFLDTPDGGAVFADNFGKSQKEILGADLQKFNSPLTPQMVIDSAKQYGVPVNYLMAIMKNDSGYGTAGKGAKTNNPGNVGNTDDGSTKHFDSREKGVDAVSENLKKRIDAYQKQYGNNPYPSLKALTSNVGPDGKGFFIGVYMTAPTGPDTVQNMSNLLASSLSKSGEINPSEYSEKNLA